MHILLKLQTFLEPLNAQDGSAVIFRNVGRYKSRRCDSQKNWTEFPSQRKVRKCVLVPNYALIYADVWWNGRTAAWMLSLCPRWRRKICFSPRRLYAREKNPWVCLTGEWEWSGPTKGLLAWWKKISSALIQLTHQQKHKLLKNKRPTLCHNLLSFILLLLCSTCFGY